MARNTKVKKRKARRCNGGVWIEVDQGRNVKGEWRTKRRRLFLTVNNGWVDISKSDKLSSPTLIEMELSVLLHALADGETKW